MTAWRVGAMGMGGALSACEWMIDFSRTDDLLGGGALNTFVIAALRRGKLAAWGRTALLCAARYPRRSRGYGGGGCGLAEEGAGSTLSRSATAPRWGSSEHFRHCRAPPRQSRCVPQRGSGSMRRDTRDVVAGMTEEGAGWRRRVRGAPFSHFVTAPPVGELWEFRVWRFCVLGDVGWGWVAVLGWGGAGDWSAVAPPVPIPNTEVKRCSADDTGGVTPCGK